MGNIRLQSPYPCHVLFETDEKLNTQLNVTNRRKIDSS